MKSLRTLTVFAFALSLAGSMAFADGSAVYKAKCASCHGANGTPNPGIAKMMGVKTTAEYKGLSEAQVEAAIKAGKGKMKPVAGISEADTKAVAAYFKSLK